jgi:alanine racemase
MLHRLKNLHKPKVETLNTITINKSAIINNVKLIKHIKSHNWIFPVLKSNAYGHWIFQMLEILKEEKFPYLIVDSFPEYQIIHNNSKFKILIMWETLPENYRYFDYNRTSIVVYNLSTLNYLISLNKRIKIHLFLNTWMNREWIQEKDLERFLKLLKNNPKISLDWVMSHLYDADSDWENHVNQQIEIFKKMYSVITDYGFSPIWKHIWASAWICCIDDEFFNAWRPWLILYWYSPFSKENEKLKWLKPALSLDSRVISLQKLTSEDWVSYGHRWIANEDCWSATVPFWYYEWWLRNLSWKLTYYYQWKTIEQIGTICMNLSCCLADSNMKIWEKIELISNDPNKKNSIIAIAEQANTIPYEILIRLDRWIRRIVD